MNRIVVLGDSLAMPRYEVPLEKTYPYLLSKELKDSEVIVRNKRANTSKNQVREQNILDDIVFLKPNIVIIHLGIVDCAPRLFNQKEQWILSKLKWINKYIIKFFSKNRYFFTKVNQKVYVSKKDFYKYTSKLIQELKKNDVEKILILNICDTNLENKKKSYGFQQNIQEYNEVLNSLSEEKNVYLLDINSMIQKNMLLEDGIHISTEGHNIAYLELIKRIKG